MDMQDREVYRREQKIELTVTANDGSDERSVSARDKAEIKKKKRGGDRPIDITGIEELPAASDGSPALAGKHREVGHAGETADEDIAIIVHLLALCRADTSDEHDSRHTKDEERNGQGAHTSGAYLLDGGTGRRREALSKLL